MKRAIVLALAVLLSACQHTVAPNARLETTPRHDEWIDVARDGRKVHTYVVYPQRADKAPIVIVIHENRGLNDWARTVADRLAEEGYIAVAPDLLSGAAPNGGNTKDFPSEDTAREAIGKLPRQQVLDDLRAVIETAKAIPSANGKVAVAGFCWGGGKVWDVANNVPGLYAAFPFYGTGPQDAAGVANIEAPVFGSYGGDDARVNATIPKTEEAMKAAGKRYEPVIYPGAGHAFMRLGEAPDASEANRNAREEAWKRWLAMLKGSS
jgi:carboxymethylenebutenolidase